MRVYHLNSDTGIVRFYFRPIHILFLRQVQQNVMTLCLLYLEATMLIIYLWNSHITTVIDIN